MAYKKTIFFILLFVSILAASISITGSEFLMKLNSNKNITIMDYDKESGKQMDQQIFENIPSRKYLVIYDSKKEYLMDSKRYIQNILDYTKKEYDLIDVEDVSQINHEYNAVIMVIEDINRLKDIDNLMKYILEGGNVFFPYKLEDVGSFSSISRKLGILDSGEYVDASGIRLLDNVMIKGKGFEITERRLMENASLTVTLTNDCKRYAESIEGTQLLWKKPYGQGNIVYFNGTMLDDKTSKGFIAGALSLLEEDYIYPIMNTKISIIDDFPAPFPLGKNKNIQNEFDGTVPEFFRDVWWPDMLELSYKYNLKYTGVIIGTYDDDVENITPDGFHLNMKDLVYYGRELLNAGGEIGIHGYNHQPLSTQAFIDQELGYKPWGNKDVMIKSIQEVNKLAKKAFPNYAFRVYVPPSNILYPEGKKALLESNTDIKIVSSVNNGDGDPDSYVQEFQVSADGMIELPRLTSGGENSDENRWGILNGITAYGCFSHFIHPDDVLDDNRNHGKGWRELFKSYTQLNKDLFNNYRWLRAMTASDGANAMMKYLKCEPKYEMRDHYMKIYCNNFYDEAYFILRTEKEIESLEDCDIEKIDENIYLVKVNESICKINYRR
ncbi:DUF2194 domain-containing protein [Marinisporobacter balticus]|uniref:DUF2194 domain-containing protein n=1 Tax=Marinisporobacter balticus TaxID=2018667 RepID=A0A4R2KCL0_9FIRM|nr:DUF2194 domain-containing protein [Marinisporobacter balticus]TCO69837.1 hypothetical protein EV214_1299 [Marinisporobacter balticus]